ncbi:MAG: DNA translocase FtsK [Muribaculaceae bacterium]|nr:DNA translocase FtsK [Muribaculaceae bacterium]
MAVSIALIALVVMIYLTQLTMLYMAWRRRVAAHRERMRLIEQQRSERERKVAESMKSSVTDDEPKAEAASTETADTVVGFEIPSSADDTIADIEDAVTPYDDIEDETTCDNSAQPPVTTVDYSDDTKPETEIEIKGVDGVDMQVTVPDIEEASEIKTDMYDPTAELSRFRFPSIDLLVEHNTKATSVDQQEQEENKDRITKTLKDYGIEISQIKATVGPTVTLYEIVPAEGVRIAKIKRLEDDIALSLAALGIRIIAPIPGKGTIGIEVPNKEPQTVSMRSIIASRKYQESKCELPMAMGSTISNEVFVADLAKMPHLLVAGATGMGKSVGLNAIITSLLYKKHPAELKFVLIDPKMVEFSLYNKLERHYLAKLPDEEDAIITDPQKVIATLNSLCVEMDNRYALLKDAGMRSLKEYNAKFIAKQLNPQKGHRYMPYIVVIVDEFADLIMTAGKEVEMPIARIAQKARAVGMHMIIATQRPSTNVITGIIKANFPGRVAFRVTQMVDSKTILDRSGANQLIGRGDMLFSRDGVLERFQ